ncbi:MAG: RagB/SusD family nutrient uptake outer membrane protein [Saprospiraceae bacterium]|nr:RagB/SusD family nutrient uptake outer membrane protein [Saprospiraceae bacterium]
MEKMKIFLSSLMLISLGFLSCTDLLEEKVYSELLSNTAYETEADAETLIISVYAGLRGSDWGTYYEYDYLMVSESGTDTYGLDQWEAGNQPLEMGTYSNSYDFILNLWDGAYKVIGSANFAIDVLENMSVPDAVKTRYIAEARFLRGLAYYDLAFNFGDVILNLGESSGNLPLSPQAEVISQVLADLTFAAENLGGATSPGRASKGAALGLRAKTHLNAKNWSEAATDARAVMDLGEYALLSSVQEVFNVANKSASEWIFAVMSVQDGTGHESQIPWFSNLGSYMNGGWGRLALAPDFFNSFDMEDERRVLLPNGYQDGGLGQDDGKDIYYALPGTPEYEALVADGTVSVEDLNSIGTSKYMEGNDRYVYGNAAYYGVNYPILRFSDILLTRAEGLNETGDVNSAIALVNEVRARSNASPLGGLDQSTLRAAILTERGKEFFMEGQRRLDLIRSGKYIEIWKAARKLSTRVKILTILMTLKYIFQYLKRRLMPMTKLDSKIL